MTYKADLSKFDFDKIKIKVNKKDFIVQHDDIIDNEQLVRAFPQYFKRLDSPSTEPSTQNMDTDDKEEDLTESTFDTEDDRSGISEIMNNMESEIDVLESLGIIGDSTAGGAEFDLNSLGTSPVSPRSLLDPEPELTTKISDEDMKYITDLIKKNGEDTEYVQPETTIEELATKPKQSIWKRFSNVVKGIFDNIYTNISENKTYVAMIIIAISAIAFDMDGWVNTYSDLPAWTVMFIVSGFYYIKYEIVDILTKYETYEGWFDRGKTYIVNFGLFLVLIAMVTASAVGIWDSLSGMTLGGVHDITVVQKQKIKFEQDYEDATNTITSNNSTIKSLASNYSGAKFELAQKNNVLQAKKEKLKVKIDGLIVKEEKLNSELQNNNNTNIADAMNIPIGEYLIWKNILWVIILELGYIFLTIRASMLKHKRAKAKG